MNPDVNADIEDVLAALCIGINAMIRNKRASGRTKDLADAELLEELRARVAAR